MKNIKPHLKLIILFFILLNGTNIKSQVKISLKNAASFPFGAAVSIKLLQRDTAYRNLVINEFSSITAESAMKFKSLHPQEKTYNWEPADYIVDFAFKNHKRLHGHTLIWDGSVPDWVANYAGDSASWESMIKNHIQTVVSHYKGKVKSWDVVNEALQDNGKYIDNIWYRKLGKDYIARCFIYAHQADPDALLFYNDHSNEASPLKRKAILKLVNNLRSRGVPIHGLGLQMHTRLAQSNEGIVAALTSAASTGLLVHISELDVSIKIGKVRELRLTPDLDRLQALKYQFIVKAYNDLPKQQQFGITTWNVSDGDSWLNKSKKQSNWPLLFDKNYKPKQSYKAVVEALKTSAL